MPNSPLTEPFFLQFDREGHRFAARVTYAKSAGTCLNIFEVEMLQPAGLPAFSLQERPVKTEEADYMIWIDQDGKQKQLYQLIGNEITNYMKNQLGVFLMDAPLNDDKSSESF